MNLSQDQVKSILNNAPKNVDTNKILDGLVDRGYTLEKVDMGKARQRILDIKRSAPANTEQFKPKLNLLQKGADLFLGGGKLAQGAGQGLASNDFFERTNKALESARKTELTLIKRIRERQEQGADTSRLEKALFDQRKNLVELEKTQEGFTGSLATNKEVIGSALRLAGSATVPTVLGGTSKGITGYQGLRGGETATAGLVSRLFGTKAVGAGAGALQGAKIGALGGGVEGAVQGAGFGLEANKDALGVASSAFVGGGLGTVAGGIFGAGIGAYTGNKALKQERVNAIRNIIENDPDSSLARYMVDGNELKKDPLAINAMKQGYTDDAVAIAKGADDVNKQAGLRMLDEIETGLNRPVYRKTHQPSNVLGETVTDLAEKNQKVMKQAGEAVNETAKSLQGQKVLNLDEPVDELMSNLSELGVRFKNGQPVFDPNGSLGGKKELQNLVKKVIGRSSTVSDDALEVHKLKQFLYDELNYSNKGKTGLGGRLERALKGFANGLDTQLDNQFPAYNVANTDYQITKNLNDEFMKVAGSTFDDAGELANMNIGDLARRISGNARTRSQLIETIYGMEKVVKGAGMTTKGDAIVQATFLDGLEEMFRKNTTATKGFAGQSALGNAIANPSRLRGKEGMAHLTMDLLADFAESGKNQEQAIKAMRELLNGSGFNAGAVATKPKTGWIGNIFNKLAGGSADEVAEGAVAGKLGSEVTGMADDVANKADDVAKRQTGTIAGATDDTAKTTPIVGAVAKEGVDVVDDVASKVVATNVLARPPVAVMSDLAQQASARGLDIDSLSSQFVKRASTANADKKFIDDIALEIANEIPDVKVATAPVKTMERTLEKTIQEGKDNIDDVNDIIRNSLVVDKYTPQRIEMTKNAVRDRMEVVSEKMQYPENYMGYEGNIMVVRTPDNAIAEIQVVSPEMTYGKMLPEFGEQIIGKDMFETIARDTGLEAGYGHKIYEQFRKLSPMEQRSSAGQALINESEEYYAKLREFTKNKNSSTLQN